MPYQLGDTPMVYMLAHKALPQDKIIQEFCLEVNKIISVEANEEANLSADQFQRSGAKDKKRLQKDL